ncbi:degenerin mec-10-like [Ptychodera flava]|uniref:degenerin mec-10-like n=1 Tax=Ptychodera flava TaxID=63121 RepID=UPI00396A0704
MEQSEYISLYGRNVGARVTITPYDIPSHPSTDGLTIMPGTRTSIGITEGRIVRLGGLYGDCYKVEDKYNSLYGGFYRYDMQSCKNLCLHSTIVNKCGCSQTMNIQSAPPCSILNKTQDLCQQLVSYFYRIGVVSCGCEKTCTDTNYELRIAQSMWPSKVYLKHLLRSLHSTNAKTRDINDLQAASLNLSNVDIHYDELTYQEIREEPAYPIESLFSDIGGSLGLYIGLSIITVFEFFEFVVEALRVCLRRDGGRHS